MLSLSLTSCIVLDKVLNEFVFSFTLQSFYENNIYKYLGHNRSQQMANTIAEASNIPLVSLEAKDTI